MMTTRATIIFPLQIFTQIESKYIQTHTKNYSQSLNSALSARQKSRSSLTITCTIIIINNKTKRKRANCAVDTSHSIDLLISNLSQPKNAPHGNSLGISHNSISFYQLDRFIVQYWILPRRVFEFKNGQTQCT